MSRVKTRRYSPRRPREERREQLLDAALRVLDRDGFGGVTVEGIAREADLAKTVVYDTFGSRDELLRVLLAREQERALSLLAAAMPRAPLADDPRQVLAEGFTTLLEGVREHSETWRLALLPPEGTPPAVRETVDRNRATLERQVQPIVAWGLDRLGAGHLDAELATSALVASGEHAIRLTLTQPDRFPPQRFADFAADVAGAIARPVKPSRRREAGA